MKIGLLAMSGIRVHDPKLLELGMTLPGVVERGRVIASLPSLGLLYLAACTPAGHAVRYYEASRAGEEPPELYGCDLVAISALSAQAFEAYAIADRLRAGGVKVAIGGLHASAMPEEASEHADYVVVGEAESAWEDVLAAAERHEPARIVVAGGRPPVDVATLPTPRYDLLGDRPYSRYTVQTTRGCPWRCDFCASTVMLGHPYRKRPIEHVVRDVVTIKRTCRAAARRRPFIEFADDNTFVDKAWGKELCRQLARLKVGWFTETDVTVAEDAELLRLMRRAGCRSVLIGLESPGPAELEGVETRRNFKARSAAGYREAVREIQSHGIAVNACFILGLDGHTGEIFSELLEFVEEIGPYDVQITVLTPFPGTPLYRRLLAEGRILRPGRWDLCTLFDVNHQPAGMSADALRKGLYWLTERLYADEAVERRRGKFFESGSRSSRIGAAL